MLPVLRFASYEDVQRLAALHVAAWHETYTGILPDGMLSRLTVESRTAQWSNILGDRSAIAATAVWVAEDGGDIVGFGACGRQRDQGLSRKGFDSEISALYVLRSHQGVGLGRALMGAMASTLRARAHRAVALWVVRENASACGFYENLGGIMVAEKTEVRLGTTLMEVAYGWHDFTALVG